MSEQKNYKLNFEGNGREYFGILIINWLLTLVTLGFYFPWARAKTLKYTYGVTSIDGNHFSFHGTGKEMFIGFLKLLVFIIVIVAVFEISIVIEIPVVGIILYVAGLVVLIPLAIHGSMRYRMSRTTLRGIRFGYRADRTEWIKEFAKTSFFTIVTFGIYTAWMEMKLQKFVRQNIRYGEVEGRFEGNGIEFFTLNLKGFFLTLITLGIYVFWWQKDLFAYMIDKTSFHKGEEKIALSSTMTGGELFILQIVNLLITVFTLGLGFAWVEMRTMKFYMENIQIEGDIDLNSITQTEEEYNNAFGEGALDFLDMDLF